MEMNAFGKCSSKIKDIINEIAICEIQQSSELSNTELILLLIEGLIIGLCLIIFIPIMYFVENRLNMLWKQIKIISEEDFFKFRKICQQRLKKLHNCDEVLNQYEKDSMKGFSKLNYVRRYMIRASIVLIIGCIYLIISQYIFYQRFDE